MKGIILAGGIAWRTGYVNDDQRRDLASDAGSDYGDYLRGLLS